MKLIFSEHAWDDYLYWQRTDKKILQRINLLIRDIQRMPYGNQVDKLQDLLACNLKTIRAYLLKEDFQRFWEYQMPGWAGRFLDEWCTRGPCAPGSRQ